MPASRRTSHAGGRHSPGSFSDKGTSSSLEFRKGPSHRLQVNLHQVTELCLAESVRVETEW